MKNLRYIIPLVVVYILLFCRKESQTLTFLQFNIWQEGTKIEKGFEAIVDEVVNSNADFVMFSEVRNYKNSRFCDRIVTALKEKGLTYYSFYSYDSGLLSRYPIIDSATIFPEINDHGSIYKLKTLVKKDTICVYTAHLDYLNCTYYEVRGYDGNTWKQLPEPITDINYLLENNLSSLRDDAILKFIDDANRERKNGNLIFLGGDFNEPSHLDWTQETKHIADHNGVVIKWNVTSMLQDNGFIDAYRMANPNPVTHPGYTFPAYITWKEPAKVTWAPKSDERERIDFIFYAENPKIKLKSSSIVGPKSSIAYCKEIVENTCDNIISPSGLWPSDHKAVIAIFKIR